MGSTAGGVGQREKPTDLCDGCGHWRAAHSRLKGRCIRKGGCACPAFTVDTQDDLGDQVVQEPGGASVFVCLEGRDWEELGGLKTFQDADSGSTKTVGYRADGSHIKRSRDSQDQHVCFTYEHRERDAGQWVLVDAHKQGIQLGVRANGFDAHGIITQVEEIKRGVSKAGTKDVKRVTVQLMGGAFEMPAIPTTADELGDLVRDARSLIPKPTLDEQGETGPCVVCGDPCNILSADGVRRHMTCEFFGGAS